MPTQMPTSMCRWLCSSSSPRTKRCPDGARRRRGTPSTRPLNTNPVSIPYVWSYEADGTLYEYQVVDGEFNSEEDYYCQFLLLNKSKWAGTLESTYGQTAFDQAVGWSRWLMLNHHEPSMWSKSGFEEELDDDL